MLFKLAFRNVKRQIGNYLIYFITVSLTVALLFSINNFILSDIMDEMAEHYIDILQPLLLSISGALSVVIAFVLGYVTSFLLRRRKKEFGLYLTMGMTRRNILAIFAGETFITFLFSLLVGLLLGVVGYQGLMAIVLSFLEQEISLASYSLSGTLVTVIMVGATFLIASFYSLVYLGNAKISRLLNGEKIVDRTDKRPTVWFIVAFAALGVMIATLIILFDLLLKDNIYWFLDKFIITLLCLVISVILLPFGLAKGVVPVLLRWKAFSARGANTFTLRQLSGRLNANASMLGMLSFLLAVAVVTTNFMTYMKMGNEANVYQRYPYDVSAVVDLEANMSSDIPIEYGLEKVEEYADIEQSLVYKIYVEDLSWQFGVEENIEAEGFIRESDYKALCSLYGTTPKKLENGYLVCWNDQIHRGEYAYKDAQIKLNGATYSYAGDDLLPTFISGTVVYYVIIVPDVAVEGLEGKYENLAAKLKNDRYDYKGLYKEIGRSESDWGFTVLSNFNIQAYERFMVLEEASIYLIISMFISVVFVLLSMAVIALKVLSILAEDKEQYRTIWRLGADEGVLKKTLFAQSFFFFFLPFGIPLALSAPLGWLFVQGAKASLIPLTVLDIATLVAGVALVLLVLYALYFTITYLIAWREVKKAVVS